MLYGKNPKNRFANILEIEAELQNLLKIHYDETLDMPEILEMGFGILNNIGKSFKAFQMEEEALKFYNEALDKEPNNVIVLCNKAVDLTP